MAYWIASGVATFIAYLLGSLPTGYLAGRLLEGVDIRSQGSGSTGATNVLRTLGAWPFAAVLLIDVAKGAAAILLARAVYAWLQAHPMAPFPDVPDLQAWTACAAGLAALVGHSRPVWLNFAGGKSVAAGLGVLLAMAWPVALGALAVFGVALAIWRIMSPGSMLAALTAIVLVLVLPEPTPYRVFVIAGGLYVVLRHRANIGRLLTGSEPRVGRRAAPN